MYQDQKYLFLLSIYEKKKNSQYIVIGFLLSKIDIGFTNPVLLILYTVSIRCRENIAIIKFFFLTFCP